MNRSLLALLCGLALMDGVFAQTPDDPTKNDPNEGVQFGQDGPTSHTLKWWGRANWTYFIQHSEDLMTWSYFPEIVVVVLTEEEEEEEPEGKPIGPYGFGVSGADRFFVRLRSLPFPITDPFDADTDGDKVSTRDEFLSGTDPLLTDPLLPFPDADGDGMSDDWETHYGLDPHDASDGGPNADLDEDGVSNLIEFQTGSYGTDPSDYYRGNYPDIRVVGWTFPTDEPGTLVAEPLVFAFSRGVNPVTKEVNVPVTVFTEGPDKGLLSETAAGNVLAVRLPLRTDANGQIRVFFKHPLAIPPVPTKRIIHVRAGSAAPTPGHFAEGTVWATSQFNYIYPPNTVGRSASEAIDSRIAGKDAASALPIFSIQHVGPPFTPDVLYERNTASWCYDLRQQMTCISPYYSDRGNGTIQYGFTAITPQHVITSGHVDVTSLLNVDDTIRFITADNPTTVITRTIRGKVRHPNYVPYYPDFTICTLDSPLPPSITPCKVLPANYASYLGYLENGRPPALILNQYEQARMAELHDLGASAPSYAYFVRPGLHRKRLEFYDVLTPGDSGNPAFLIIKPPNTGLDTLVLLTTWTSGGAGSGTFVTPLISDLNAMIALADADVGNYFPFVPMNTGLQVQTIDLSGFNTFTPPP